MLKIYTVAAGEKLEPGDLVVAENDGFVYKFDPNKKTLEQEIEERRMPYQLEGEYPYFYNLDFYDDATFTQQYVDALLEVFWKHDHVDGDTYDPEMYQIKAKKLMLYAYVKYFNYRTLGQLHRVTIDKRYSKQLNP